MASHSDRFDQDHPIFAGFSPLTNRSRLLVPDHVVEQLAAPDAKVAGKSAAKPSVRAKPPLPHPPGPNDLGMVTPERGCVKEQVRELTARVLTDRHLEGIDTQSATIFRKLFVDASVFVVESDDCPATWDEVIRFLDDRDECWSSPKQIVTQLLMRKSSDREYLVLLSWMSEEVLSGWLYSCRRILRIAVNEALAPIDQSHKSSPGRTPKRSRKAAVVEVFTLAATQRALKTVGNIEEKLRAQAHQALDAAGMNGGRRFLPDVRKALANLNRLGRTFENLAEPINHLRTELTLASAMAPEDFRISPILLLGDPGIGKTYLALQLANALGVPMEKISAGSAQGAFQLTGSHPSWTRAMMGSVFKLLAEGTSATPVLVIDEVDKIGEGGSYPVMPALLDLLEHNTAKTFRDEFVDMQFDASRLVVVMTANVREAIPAPLLSRTALFEVPRPEQAQRRRIIEAEIAELAKKTGKRFALDDSAADDLAACVDLDLRQTRRAVVKAFADALTSRKKTVVPKISAISSGRRSMGFV